MKGDCPSRHVRVCARANDIPIHLPVLYCSVCIRAEGKSGILTDIGAERDGVEEREVSCRESEREGGCVGRRHRHLETRSRSLILAEIGKQRVRPERGHESPGMSVR